MFIFKKTLRHMGVNLDVKKAQLYRTFGVDFYRRNLKSIVKGNSQLEKDFSNANEIMQIDSNAFPEFENYVIGEYNKNQINLALLNNMQIDLNSHTNYSNNNIINNEINQNKSNIQEKNN